MRCLALLIWLILPFAALAQDQAPKLDVAASSVTLEAEDLLISLRLTRGIPYRLTLVAEPKRLIVDMKGAGADADDLAAIRGAELFEGLRNGPISDGWHRLVFQLRAPYAVESATMKSGDSARLDIRLVPVAAEEFVGASNAVSAMWNLPEPTTPVVDPARPRPVRVAIDPGHGGIDAGAVEAGLREADLMLDFAHELTEKLIRAGFEVVLTRRRDEFVGLEARMTEARASKADLLISLHADALPDGQAAGAAIFTWNTEADDRASRQLAARHDRADLVAGLDLAGTDDHIAATLMDMARADTQPRSEALAQHMSSSLAQAGLALRSRPVKGAAFSVLKSPDIPSVLVELGFLTDAGDRENLTNDAWRARMAGAISQAVVTWSEDDTARATLRRH
ncbi:N-acetylmuramoyl-L-alanine amidase family protein [Paracoccus albus]|uniref:N-acetylmuramoyl-L-alanine amidase family protein n=1 Tax=Paracoccus albus TaxID=3017784 RepID=UPI0022F12F8F|nr:N-acetylmuramoyl-L-alanine amidase [Paracoccus albus]WBU61373.1 N-acetylmuramoyl-L-alanine amidase [Paracoccus albus]